MPSVVRKHNNDGMVGRSVDDRGIRNFPSGQSNEWAKLNLQLITFGKCI